MSAQDGVQTTDLLSALVDDLHLLARCHDREQDAESIAGLIERHFPACMHLQGDSETSLEAVKLLTLSLESLSHTQAGDLDELAADYADIYLNHSIEASPLESVWLDEDGLVMQQPMFDVRNWYEKYGLQVENWRVRSDDHLAFQLQFMAHLVGLMAVDESEDDVLMQDLARFLDEHTLRWTDEFARRVATRCGTSFYAGVALVTVAYLDALRNLLAEVLDEARPTAEEIEKRLKPKPVVQAVPIKFTPGVSPSW